MPLNQQQLFERYKSAHFEQSTKIDGQEARMPKPEKVVEWALLSILETLQAINGHLARLASRP